MAHQPKTDRTTTPPKGECSSIDVSKSLKISDLTINPIDKDGDFIIEIQLKKYRL